jgi:hypothetical protein
MRSLKNLRVIPRNRKAQRNEVMWPGLSFVCSKIIRDLAVVKQLAKNV